MSRAPLPSISVIMPALNEEGNLAAAVASVEAALHDRVAASEILIFNDGSTDRTGVVADELTRQNPRIHVIHNTQRMGLGDSYRRGVEMARYDFVVMIPADNEVPEDSIKDLVDRVGTADAVLAYFVNPWVRPRPRRVVSRAFVGAMNFLFGLKLRYYNGPCIIRTRLVRAVSHQTRGFAYMAAILVRLLTRGRTFVEVGVHLRERKVGRSKALSIRNVLSVVATILRLFWDVYLKGRYGRGARIGASDHAPRHL